MRSKHQHKAVGQDERRAEAALDVNYATVIGWVISRLEVVQHALGVGKHKPALLPLPALWQVLPPAVLTNALLQVPGNT